VDAVREPELRDGTDLVRHPHDGVPRACRFGATAGALLVLVLLGAIGAPARAQTGLRVEEIRFEGNRRYSDENLLLRLRLKKGEIFDTLRLEEDIKLLYRFFRDVRVEKEVRGVGVHLTFHVVENPRIVAVRLIGNTEFETEDMLEWLQTERGYPLFQYALAADRQEILRHYREEGYHFAEVVTDVYDEGGGKLVTFVITEGPMVTIDEIEFRGNESFDESELRKNMVSEETVFLSTGAFVQDTLEKDILAILGFYRSEGYRDARAWLGSLEFSEDKVDARIRIDIEEGEPYFIDEIRIEGGETFPADRSVLEKLLTVEVGDRLRDLDIQDSMEALRNFYRENAYYAAQVTLKNADYVYRSEGTGAGVVFVIDEGRPVSIDRIVIEGNEKTKDKVIRREISLVPGGPLNTVELRKSVGRLWDLRYFSRVDPSVRDTADPSRKDVVLRVEEGSTGNIRFSAGINSNLGLLGDVTITKQNFDLFDWPKSFRDLTESRAFTGGGQFLRLSVSPGTTYSTFRVTYREPWLFDHRLGGEVDFYKSLLFRPGYDVDRLGFRMEVDKRFTFKGDELDDRLRLAAGFRIENPRIRSVDPLEAPQNAVEDEGLWQVRSLILSASYSRVDSFSFPTRGWTTSFDYEWGTPLGTIEFHKFFASGSHYWTLYRDRQGRRHILAVTGDIGYQLGYGGTSRIPISERFFMGGLGTVRGFSYRTIGPKDNGEPVGGEARYRVSLQYDFPVYERLLGGVLFLDAGNVALKWGGPDFLEKIRVTPGVGVRVSIPILGQRPVQLDFGFAVRKFDGDRLQVFSFSFGREF
jgi:outer membrane protein insertion porin family